MDCVVLFSCMLWLLFDVFFLCDVVIVELVSVVWYVVCWVGDVVGWCVLVVGSGLIGVFVVVVFWLKGVVEIVVVDMYE